MYFFTTQSYNSSCDINGYVAATDDYHFPANFNRFTKAGCPQQVCETANPF